MKRRITDYELKELVRALENSKVSVRDTISWIKDQGPALAETPFTASVSVNYSLTIEEMIQSANCTWVDERITDSNFPRHFYLLEQKIEVLTRIFRFERSHKSSRVVTKMRKSGYRPATLPELIAINRDHPELQKSGRIIALGSIWHSESGRSYVTGLDTYQEHLGITCFRYDREWTKNDRFLGVFEKK